MGGVKRRSYETLRQTFSSFNMIELTITKPDSSTAKKLSDDDIVVFMFDLLKIPPEECVEFNFFAQAHGKKFFTLKQGVNAKTYATKSPIDFRDHSISAEAVAVGTTRVRILYAGLDIPDEEILNLLDIFGEVVSIQREPMRNAKKSR